MINNDTNATVLHLPLIIVVLNETVAVVVRLLIKWIKASKVLQRVAHVICHH